MIQKLTISDFNDIFRIMSRSFPTDEYRTRPGQRSIFSDPAYSVYGEREDGKLIGFIAVWEFDDLMFIEHFAVDSNHRNCGIGSKMLGELLKSTDKTVCLEVELPADDITRRRIGFYERCGFYFNDYAYTQPAMACGKKPIPLSIMTYGGKVGEAGFESIRDTLYRYVYHVRGKYNDNL